MITKSSICALALLVSTSTATLAGGGEACGHGPYSGPYIGAFIGAAGHSDEKNDRYFGSKFDDETVSATGGILAGYNWQCGQVVYGIEGDVGFLDSGTSQADPLAPTARLSSDVNWMSTLRLRVGLARSDDVLFYFTGGLAFADIDHKLSDPIIDGGFPKTNSDLRVGWTVGGGVELTRSGNWGLRAEALYVDFGDKTETYSTTCCTASYGWHDDFWLGRVGLTYRFGDRTAEHAPLK